MFSNSSVYEEVLRGVVSKYNSGLSICGISEPNLLNALHFIIKLPLPWIEKKILMVWWFLANCPPSWEATWSQLHWRKRTPVVKYVSLRHTTPSVLRGRLHVKVIPIFGKAELWFGNSSRHEAVKISVKYVWSVCDDGSSKHETCEY